MSSDWHHEATRLAARSWSAESRAVFAGGDKGRWTDVPDELLRSRCVMRVHAAGGGVYRLTGLGLAVAEMLPPTPSGGAPDLVDRLVDAVELGDLTELRQVAFDIATTVPAPTRPVVLTARQVLRLAGLLDTLFAGQEDSDAG